MARLKELWAIDCCFDQLPGGVSTLTALEELRLGWHCADAVEIDGDLDARALGFLNDFPNLRKLGFENYRVLFCADFQAAAAHPRLERLELQSSYPASGPSRMAFVGFVITLLQRGRPDVLKLTHTIIEGAGQESRDFRAALQAVGYPLSEADAADLV